MPPNERWCVLCGVVLVNRRRDARHCSASCRAESSRLRRLLAGVTVEGRYGSLRAYSARQKRTTRDTRGAT